MKELSIFVDESGDFGAYSKRSPYYLFSLVFHEQDKSIDGIVDELDRKVVEHGFPVHAIHTGPIIRNEGYYSYCLCMRGKRLIFINEIHNISLTILIKIRQFNSGAKRYFTFVHILKKFGNKISETNISSYLFSTFTDFF